MSTPRSAVALLRSLDLMPDGPTLWGEPVRSRTAGILLVEVPARLDAAPIDVTVVRAWIERVPGLRLDGERPTPTQLASRLAAFWLPQETVVYVGRTSKGLAGRAASLFGTPLGDRRPHPGGHWLSTLLDRDKLRIWWAETDSPEEYEDALFDAIAADLDPAAAERIGAFGPLLPWANLTAATGDAKRTGLTGSFLAESEPSGRPTPATTSGGDRSSAASARRRPAAGGARSGVHLVAGHLVACPRDEGPHEWPAPERSTRGTAHRLGARRSPGRAPGADHDAPTGGHPARQARARAG